jgi:hypothetical protein
MYLHQRRHLWSVRREISNCSRQRRVISLHRERRKAERTRNKGAQCRRLEKNRTLGGRQRLRQREQHQSKRIVSSSPIWAFENPRGFR